MPTNKEFLYSLEPHELTEWFESEHGSNDTLGSKKVVSAESVDANGANAASLKVLSHDTQNVTDDRETAETPNNSDENVTDSREKLEADIKRMCAPGNDLEVVLIPRTIYEWLDRQAVITERAMADELEAAYSKNRALKLHISKMQDGRNGWHVKAKQLQEQVDELTAERDALADDLLTCNRERETLRKQLGIALDHAHDMLALVDMDGNVYDYGD